MGRNPRNRSGSERRSRQPDSGRGQSVIRPRGAGVYPHRLTPIAMPGDYVKLKPDDKTYRVELIEPQPGLDVFNSETGDGLSVPANDILSDQRAEALEQRDKWLGQMRLVNPTDDIPADITKVEADQGGAQQPLWTSVNGRGYIDDTDTPALVHESGVTEFYVFEDQNAPSFTFHNDTGAAVTVEDIQFAGYQMFLAEESVPRNVQPVVAPTKAISSVSTQR